jgi:hypothetical protein
MHMRDICCVETICGSIFFLGPQFDIFCLYFWKSLFYCRYNVHFFVT